MITVPTIPESCITLVRAFEGLSCKPYVCPAGYLTIGVGHRVIAGESFGIITEEEAYAILRKDLRIAAAAVVQLTSSHISENQYAALISFVFNLGSSRYRSSTLRRKVNSGDYEGAAKEFAKWIYSGKRILLGLRKRREAEALLFRS